MTISRAAAQSITNIRTGVRRRLGDPDTNPLAVSIPAALRRWSDTAIEAMINRTLMELGTEMAIMNSGDALTYVDTTYSDAGTAMAGMALPSGIDANGIYKVEDIGNLTYPIALRYVHPDEIQNYINPPTEATQTNDQFRVYTLTATQGAVTWSIVVRPTVSRAIRIWFVAAPLVTSEASDSPLLSNRWLDLIEVMTAIKLMEIDDEAPEQLVGSYQRLYEQFRQYASRQKAAERVRVVRVRT